MTESGSSSGALTAAITAALRSSGWWLLAGALIYLSFGYTEMMGSDLWWHLAAGREIAQNASPWLVDDWSYTESGSVWRNHEWLADLVFYGWATAFGVASLVYWKWLLIIAAFALLQAALLRRYGDQVAALLASGLAVAIAAPFLDVRPQLYTLLGVAVLLNLALQRTAKLRELLPLFLLWANLHGGFIFGLMLLGVLQFPWREFSLQRLARLAVTLAACALVCLINPDGVKVFWLPLEYALDADSPYRHLAEWRSPFDAGGIRSPLYPYSLVVAATVAISWALPFVRRAVPLRPELLAFALLCAAMSVTSRRFIVLWAFAFAALLAPFAAAVLRRRLLRPLAPLALLLATGFGLWRLAPYPLRADVAYHYLTAEYAYPHAVADVVARNELRGKAFTYYNWGGFLHWRVDGALKVYIDGRANTLFSDRTYLDYVAVLGARPGWIERIENSGADYFLWPRTRGGQRLISGLLDTRRWRLLYQGVRGVLLVRADHPLPRTLRLPRNTVQAELAAAFAAFRRADYRAADARVARAQTLRPWDYEACAWRRRTLQALGQGGAAGEVLVECRAWFPSRYLR